MTVGSTMLLRSTAPQATQAIAGTVAARLQPGDVIALTGDLGAGKTCFVQGAARALGVQERVKSPSFLLRRDYEGRVGITHVDVYRLETLDDVVQLGHDEPEQQRRITFIEWADAVRPLLPENYLEVELRLPEIDDSETPAENRIVAVRPYGGAWSGRFASMREDCREWLSS